MPLPTPYERASARFRRAPGRAAPNLGDLRQTAAELTALQQQTGARAVPRESFRPWESFLDLIMRGTYASAGAFEEAFTPQGQRTAEGPVGRVFRELFSGIGGLQGEKRAFGEVLERAGFGTGPSFSDLLPFLYSETGQGLPLERHGALDPTGRGVTGLALDIFLDPLTYVGGAGVATRIGGKSLSRAGEAALQVERAALTGSKAAKVVGIQAEKEAALLAGRTIPATKDIIASGFKDGTVGQTAMRDYVEQAARGKIAAAIKAGRTDLVQRGGIYFAGYHLADSPFTALRDSAFGKAIIEKTARLGATPAMQAFGAWWNRTIAVAGKMFVKGYGIRGLVGAQEIIDDVANEAGMLRSLMEQDIKNSPLAKYASMEPERAAKFWRRIAHAYETGGIPAVKAIDEEVVPAMEYFARKNESIFRAEVQSGLMRPEREVINYWGHFYDNSAADFGALYYKKTGKTLRGLTWRPHLEERIFETLQQAEEWSTRANKFDPSIPILKPVYNPVEVLRRRWENSISIRSGKQMVQRLEKRFGKEASEFIVSETWDLAAPQHVRISAQQTKELMSVREAVAKGGTPKHFVRKLSREARQEFLRLRFLRIGSRDEAARVIAKYGDFMDDMPRLVKPGWDRAADGSVFTEMNVGTFRSVIPSSLAQELVETNTQVLRSAEMERMLRGYDRITNFWKGSVTWLFPSFHVRNAYSNVAQAFVDIGLESMDPRRYRDAVRILFTKQGGALETKAGRFAFSEVRDLMRRHGVIAKEAAFAELTGEGLRKSKTWLGKTFEKGRSVGTSVENVSRAQLFLAYLRRGIDPAEAGRRVNKFLFDYEKGLTQFERNWMRRVIPFYTWTRKNLTLMLENITKRPGKLATEIKPFHGRQSENEYMTDWEAGALKIRLNRDGRTVQMITGVDLPIRNLDLIWRGNVEETVQGVLGMVHPFLKLPFELATGTELFLGRSMDRKTSGFIGRIMEPMPQAMRDWFGWKKEIDAGGRPRYTFDGRRFYLFFQSYAFSRVISTSDRVFRDYLDRGDTGWQGVLLDVATGLRAKNLNLDEEQRRMLNERIRQLRENLVRRGALKRFETTYENKRQSQL